MATTKDRALFRQLGTLFNVGAVRELTDGQLLERFARGEGEATELAFAALVERHGAMVMRVCRAQLADPNDAQDAFQATFLVLVEKARGLWVRDSLGPWLHQVALRTALCARSSAIRRQELERRAAEITARHEAQESPCTSDLARVLHQEIDRLPERYRVPIVLCDLEGHTCEEAARVMGRPVGTIKCWRARGRERLRRRLIRAGLAPSVALGTAMAPDIVRAAVAGPVAEQAVRTAIQTLSGGGSAGVVPASVSTLVKGVIQSMVLRKLRMTVAAVCALAFLGTGLVTVTRVAAEDPTRPADDSPAMGAHRTSGLQPPPTIPQPAASGREQELARAIEITQPPTVTQLTASGGESWPLSLRDAIRTGLDNNRGVVRVISMGAKGRPVGGWEPPAPRTKSDPVQTALDAAPIVIAPRSSDMDAQRFKSEIMAEIRSIEQQYWTLAAAHVQLWAADRAVNLAQEVLNREQAELKTGRGTAADVAEAAQRLEQFKLDLVTRTSDVFTVERQFRNLLGLPPADNRRIIPATPATEARLEPDWNKALATMLEKQPDIQLARASVREAERLAASEAEELNRAADTLRPDIAGKGKPSPEAAIAGHPSPLVERRRYHLQQVVHGTTHSLARSFQEIDANYKAFQTASRLRATAAQRLDVQRAYFEEGRITMDRFLDSVSQYTTAVATEVQYKATYNISIAALEEAKGTLLEFDKIVVSTTDGPNDVYLLWQPYAFQNKDHHGAKSDVSLAAGVRVTGPPLAPSDSGVNRAPQQPAPPAPPPVAIPATTREAAGPPRTNETTNAGPAGTTYSFHLTVGVGSRPLEIRGSFTVAPAPVTGGSNP